MLTQLRSLADLSLVSTRIPRAIWAREGWTDATTLPLKRGTFRLRLRHTSGGFPPLEICADWDGARFNNLRGDPLTAIPSTMQQLADALFQRFDSNADQWDITAWIRDGGTQEQPVVH